MQNAIIEKMKGENKYKRPHNDDREEKSDDSLTRLEKQYEVKKQRVNQSIEQRLEIKKDKEKIEEKFKLKTTPYW